ncbi:leucine-rich repeat flightless-interacting protein 2-like isoform X7 [Polyodon spathula]|uniref:leucine-rich repeat flightless-interacting protein 2-like isoform X7 n=1 Tax=Polyodon spathula TaxID=7913 RepID=UPI001B7DBF26|nr:leucine-rich repeat flightless-interacting protein 2-like isoform X7 [Polyodon spathula]
MGTPGSGRKRAPIKDRFSAEDEALGSIAREAEARLAAKRAARAEARDIRMRELERQQKELSRRSSDRKWGQINQWVEDTEKAKYGHRSSGRHHRGVDDDVMSVRSVGSYRHSSSLRDVSGSHKSRASTSRRRDLVSDSLKDKSSTKSSRSSSSSYSASYGVTNTPVSSNSRKDLLSGYYHDQRNYRSLKHSKPISSYHTRSSSLYSDPLTTTPKSYRSSSSTDSHGLTRSYSLASLCDDGLYGSYSSLRAPSEYSYSSSSRASSTRSSPMSSDDDTASTVSQDRASRGRQDSVLDDKSDKHFTDSFSRPVSRNAVPGLSAAALASLGGTSSRRGSGDVGSIVDPDASLSELRDIYDLKDQIQDVEGRYMQGLKELKDSLTEVEEKYKKAMVSNAQLDNEKANLIYQVDTLKDVVEEMEELMAEMYRETEDKSKELERQKHTCNVLQHKIEELKEGVRQRDELIEENQGMQQKLDSCTREVFDLQETINWKDKKIGALERQKEYFDCIRNERDELRDELAVLKGKMKTGEKHGLVIIPEGMPNGDLNHQPVVGSITVVTQEAAQVLESAGEGPLGIQSTYLH